MADTVSRAERKERTRQSLIDVTLEMAAERSFASVSLREVARAAGLVPTAFYRHFPSMEDLGVAAVEDSMRALRHMLREARRTPSINNARDSLAILVRQLRANTDRFRFLIRERDGGVSEVRRAIDTELRLFASELTIDLSRTPGLTEWGIEDLEMTAGLIVTTMLATVADLLDSRPGSDAESAVITRAEKQLRLILLGMTVWKSSTQVDQTRS